MTPPFPQTSALHLTTLPIMILQQIMRELPDADIRRLITIHKVFRYVVDFDPILKDGWQHGNEPFELCQPRYRAKECLTMMLKEKKSRKGFGKDLIELDESLTPEELHAFDAQFQELGLTFGVRVPERTLSFSRKGLYKKQDGATEDLGGLRSLNTVVAHERLFALLDPSLIKHLSVYCGNKPMLATLGAYTCLETLKLTDLTCHQVVDVDCRCLSTTLTTLDTNEGISLHHIDHLINLKKVKLACHQRQRAEVWSGFPELPASLEVLEILAMPVWPNLGVLPRLPPSLPPFLREFRHTGPLDFTFETFHALQNLKVIEFKEVEFPTVFDARVLPITLEELTIERSSIRPTLHRIIGLDHLLNIHTLSIHGDARWGFRNTPALHIDAALPEGPLFPPCLSRLDMFHCHISVPTDKLWPSSIVGLRLRDCRFSATLLSKNSQQGDESTPTYEELTIFPPSLAKLFWSTNLPLSPNTCFPKTLREFQLQYWGKEQFDLPHLPASLRSFIVNMTKVQVLSLPDGLVTLQSFNGEVGSANTESLKLPLRLRQLRPPSIDLLKHSCFSKALFLQDLNLANQGLKSLQGIVFPLSLKTIILQENELKHIDQNTFPEGLTTLDLRSNKLVSVADTAFPTSLEVLRLSHNVQLEIKKEQKMQWPPRLRYLNAEHCPLLQKDKEGLSVIFSELDPFRESMEMA